MMRILARISIALYAYLAAGMPGALAAAEQAIEAAGAHEAGEKVGLPQFNPASYPSQLFWLAVIFAILYFFFAKKTLPEISGVIESRNARISNDIETAEKLRSEAESVQKFYEESLEKARTEAARFYNEADIAVKAHTASTANAFREKSSKEIEATEKRLQKAKKAAMEEMSTIAAEIASHAAEKIVGVSINLDQAKSLVQSIYKSSKKAA
jgi:F-type H+-transporting ATPase subunit b